MENMVITKLSSLDKHYMEETVALLVDSFYDMFKGISKKREPLLRLFYSCLQPDLIYVLTHNNQVMGFIAVSDQNQRTIIIHEEPCISIFGSFKGKILAWQLQKILSVPAVHSPQHGYIDFIATAPEFKRHGVATRLLTYIEDNTDFRCLFLDVLASNQSAICFYEKTGFQVDTVKKNIWMRLAGIKTMNIMKKEL